MSKSKKRSNELEVLQSVVNTDGSGEDPAVQALLSDQFVQGSNQEALNIALALQQIVRGQNALLENQDKFANELNRLNQKMAEMDKAAERWETDRENFIQEVLDRAASMRADGFEKDKLIAKGSQQFADAISQARAQQAVDNAKFEESLRQMPTVSVVSAGELVMIMENGVPTPKLMDETVKIKSHKWILPAGRVTEVPLVVKEVLDQRRRIQAEKQEREQLLASNIESSKIGKQWDQISKKFGTSTDPFPTI